MITAATNLESIVTTYLNDTEFQQSRLISIQQRDTTLPTYQHIIEQFISGELNLVTFRSTLDKQLRQDDCWGKSRLHLLHQLSKLASYHAKYILDTEGSLRTILTGLNAANLAQRIEQFYQRIERDCEQLSRLPDKDPRKMVSPRSSSFIISLIAFWLDPTDTPYVYSYPMRVGLALLLKEKLVPMPSGIRIFRGDIEIATVADHQAVITALYGLGAAAPRLKTDSYWAEYFLSWVQDQAQKEANFFKNTYVFIDQEIEDESEITDSLALEETPIENIEGEKVTHPDAIENRDLKPTPEPLLTQLIAELRRHILVEESVVRDIYYALLGGHLILTGPPGTGKTDLARLIPEILWQSEEILKDHSSSDLPTTQRWTTRTAYTTTVVTATAEWNTRTLMSSIVPVINEKNVSYQTQYGHLVQAILRNWTAGLSPDSWEVAQRVLLRARSAYNGQKDEEFRGHWLIIDEFNRAHIDAALGEALTALSTGEALHIMIEGKPVKLPLPRDFRIIGTLNSFDRHYLNQISEALKRRFAFIEILPPSRKLRQAERAMVLYKALKDCVHLAANNTIDAKNGEVTWQNVVIIATDGSGLYENAWEDLDHPLHKILYESAWPIFEVIRIYRQLGTAQAIALVHQMLIRGILEQYSTQEQWEVALDAALSNLIADQLQVILTDELDVLLWHLTLEKEAFISRYHNLIVTLNTKRRRLASHIEALHRIVNAQGEPLLSDEAIERLLDEEEELSVVVREFLTPELLTEAFHLDHPAYKLPRFTKRLRTFKAEQGL